LGSGDTIPADDLDVAQNSSGTTHTNLATVTHPTWPTETDIVYVNGTNKAKLSLQSSLLRAIFHIAFDKVRYELLFDHAFPNAITIPKVVRRSLVAAAEARTFVNGEYSASAACVHQRLLSDDDYQDKMTRLVSNITLTTTYNN
jgi:hypothetical protein